MRRLSPWDLPGSEFRVLGFRVPSSKLEVESSYLADALPPHGAQPGTRNPERFKLALPSRLEKPLPAGVAYCCTRLPG
jgi:hypothetical protein